MQLLEGYEYRQIRSEFQQINPNGQVRGQIQNSVFMLLGFRDRGAIDEFVDRCSRVYSEDVLSIYAPGAAGTRRLVLFRGAISKLLKRLDPEWGGDSGTYSKTPAELESQWKLAKNELPTLLASGTMVENLRRKQGGDTALHVWVRHPAEALAGTDADRRQCGEFFEEWVEQLPSDRRMPLTSDDGPEADGGDDAMDVVEQLGAYKNVIVEGVAGSGKTHLLERLKAHYAGRTTVLVFHPSTSYEDFVVGLRPTGSEFAVVPGPFLVMCERAARDPEHDYLLFIDEVNRANTARVLGDLLMVIEASKRAGAGPESSSGDGNASEYWEWRPEDYRTVLTDEELRRRPEAISVQLQTPLEGGRKHLVVPRNLHVLGTMNTTDRSIGTIDLALRRRFHWRTAEVLVGARLQEALEPQQAERLGTVIEWHERANETLRTEVGPDSQLGHSYFFARDASAEEVAEALLHQLAEIAHTFNIGEAVMERLFDGGAASLPDGRRLRQVGKGLGRRFVIGYGAAETGAASSNDIAP